MTTLVAEAAGSEAGAESAAVDGRHPWLGLASFSEETRAFFYGREEEVAELSRRVQRKLLTVLFGQSGLGKTSILRAGIVPRLRAQGYCPVYVRIDYGPDAPGAALQIKEAVLRETAAAGSWTRAGVAAQDESLWEFFHHRDDVLQDAQGKVLTPLLIFDQFEEIFTLAQADDGGRQRAALFLDGLAELVENRPSKALEAQLEEDDTAFERFDFARNDYRVLITLREDYLAHLESLKGAMPSITQNRMRLAPMTGQQALAAVTGPGGRLVSEEVAGAIVRFVAGGAELAHAQVEPSLLSLICRELNDKRIAAQRDEITLDLLAGSHASILTDFYERALLEQSEAVRSVIEDGLLTASGYRENVAEERVLQALAAAGAAPDARGVLALLVNRRLLRIEERLDVRRVELTHDVLCGVVQASRALRHEREQLAVAARALASQRERERVTRHALVRARRITTGCVILTVLAVGSAIFGFINMKRAQETQAQADRSRAGAEKLVGFLLDDFYAELEPIGRLDMVGELASRTSSYYQGLPAATRNRESEANHARALLRLGEVQLNKGNLTEAATTLDQAVTIITPIAAADKAAQGDVLALANSLRVRALVAYRNGEIPKAKVLYDRAIAISKPLALAPGASKPARLEYALALTRAGYIKLREIDSPGAQLDLRAARDVLGNETERKADLAWRMAYLEAGQWLHETFTTGKIKDYVQAEVLAHELLSDAQEILKERPNHQPAMRTISDVSFNRAANRVEQRKDSQALQLLSDGIIRDKELQRIDPHNEYARLALSIDLGFQGIAYRGLGRPMDAKASTDKIWELYANVEPASFHVRQNLSSYAWTMAEIYAELGQPKPLEEMRGRLGEYARIILNGKEATAAKAVQLFLETNDLALSDVAGDVVATQASLADLRRRAEAVLAQANDKETVSYVQSAIATAQRVAAHLAYAGGDYVQAEASSRQALDFLLKADPGDLREPVYRMEHALALARLHRLPEAREQIKLVLNVQRALIADGADDQLLRLELAQSLFVSALCQPTAGTPELKEAAKLVAQLPAAIQGYRSVRLWRTRINDEIRLNSRAAQ
jgi:tetratricopeptide (TPR) repeat protein